MDDSRRRIPPLVAPPRDPPVPLKCSIVNLDSHARVEALYNPKDLQVDKQVSWSGHKGGHTDSPALEFSHGEARGFDVELFFDTYESREDVYKRFIGPLATFTLIDSHVGRPPMCLFLWGMDFQPFMGVILSMQVKYTCFLSNGRPVRATCHLKMMEGRELRAHGAATRHYALVKYEPKYDKEGRLVKQDDRLRPDRFGDDHRQVLDEAGSEDGTLDPGKPAWLIYSGRGPIPKKKHDQRS